MAKELKIRITGDSSGLKAGTDEAEGILKGFGGKISAFSVASGELLADGLKTGARAAVGFIGDSIGAAGDLNESLSKNQQLFGAEQAAAIEKFADGAAVGLGQSKIQALDAAGTFAVFGKAAGLAGEDLTKFATQNTSLASDMASFFNTSPEEAIESIGAAFRGESEPIRKYGVMLDATSIKAEAISKGFAKATVDQEKFTKAEREAKEASLVAQKALEEYGEGSDQARKATQKLDDKIAALNKVMEGKVGDLTQEQKILAAQSLIMEQTADAQGDFAKTSGGLANQQRILAAQFDNLKTSVGQAFLPVMLDLVSAVNSKVLPALMKFGPIVAENIGGAVRAAVGWFKDLTAVFQEGGWKAAVGSLATDLGSLASTIGAWFSGTLLPLVGGWLAELGKKFGTWVTETAVPYLQANLPEWIAAFYGWYYGTALPWLGEQIWELAKKLGQEWIPAAVDYLGANLPIWGQRFDDWMTGTALPWLAEKGGELAVKLSDWVLDAANYLLQNLPVWIGKFQKWFATEGIPMAVKVAGDLALKFIGAMGEIAGDMWQIGVDIVQGLIDGLVSMAGDLAIAAGNLVTNNIPGPVRSLLGISSPSKLFYGFGQMTAQGLALGMVDGAGMVSSAAASLARSAVPGYSPAELSGGMTVDSLGAPGMTWQSANQAVVVQMDGREVGRGLLRPQQLNGRAAR